MSFKSVGIILVGMVLGVAVFAVIFSENGTFNDLLAIPTSGALADNAYSGIIMTVFGLIPVGVLAYFGMRIAKSKADPRTKTRTAARKRQSGRI